MKSLLIILVSFTFSQLSLGQSSLANKPSQSIDQGLPILYVFSGSDWCKPCIKLKKEVIDTPTFQAYATNKFSIRIVDFPYKKANKLSKEEQATNNELAELYNPEGLLPNLILVENDKAQVAPLRNRSTISLQKEIDALLEN